MLAQHLLMAAGDTGPKGQVVFLDLDGRFHDWTVPEDVYEIHVLLVGSANGKESNHITQMHPKGVYTNTLFSSETPLSDTVGGGDGGSPGRYIYGGRDSAGGGAAGYLGNGGDADKGGAGALAQPGQGGGGGGGGDGLNKYIGFQGGFGGGVGLQGIGPSGAAGVRGVYPFPPPTNGGHGSPAPDGLFVGMGVPGSNESGSGSDQRGSFGANLRYTTMQVTPGQKFSFQLYQSYARGVEFNTVYGAARIMWGGGRSYPYNAGDV